MHLRDLLFDADGVLYTRAESTEFFVRGLLACHGLNLVDAVTCSSVLGHEAVAVNHDRNASCSGQRAE